MRKLALSLLLAALLVPFALSAHLQGYSLEYASAEGFFDIGHSDPFVEGTPIRFDLELAEEKGGDLIPFTGTWVRISQGPKTVFAGPIGLALFGSPGFTYVFPEEGDYELSIRFENEKGSIAQHAFAITVANDGERDDAPVILAAIASAALGGAVGYAVFRVTRKR